MWANRTPDEIDHTAAELEQFPDRSGRYEIYAVLGTGSYGDVYKGYDEDLRREVAIKVPHPHRITCPSDVDLYLAQARGRP